MQKTEAQHNHTQNQPAQRQGRGASLESPQGEQIAQLEAMVDSSPQAVKLAQAAAAANNSPQAAAQRRMMDMIHNGPRMTAQRKEISAIHNSPSVTAQRQQIDSLTGEAAQREEAEEPLQEEIAQREEAPAKPNNTGLPDNLKSGIESLSGMSMDNVKVHYNSSQPAQLNALAYAQGTDIHVAPGQEQHLPHEAWHVVQQAQGRVQPTMQMKDGVPVNDDAGLEYEADVMGEKALGFSGTGNGILQQKRPEASVVQRLSADDVKVFFRGLKAAPPGTLNLYTHVMADGVGDAGLVGHLHEKITGELGAYGIGNVQTYLAVEKFVSLDDQDIYDDEHPDDNIADFAQQNPYIENEAPEYRDLVLGLSHANAANVTWAVSANANAPRKPEGREASNIPADGWEIQYPVPASAGAEDNKLKIKEMGVNAIATLAKTGEIGGGIGYGIPELNSDMNEDETAVMAAAEEVCDPARAWLASIKGVGGVDPLPRVVAAARQHGGDNTLVYLPGGIGANLANNEMYAVNDPIINQGGLSLRKLDMQQGGTVYVITGVFRNEFIHHCMTTITNGVILSGGEGLYTESLATEGDNVAPMMAPRYNYQMEEVVRAIAANQGELAVVNVNQYEGGGVAASDLFADYGLIQINGVTHTYNQEAQELKSLYGVGTREVHAEPPADLPLIDPVQVGYSRQLSSFYFPLSLNTDKFSHVPAQFDFQIAKTTFAAERDRLKEGHNWFALISEIGGEQEE